MIDSNQYVPIIDLGGPGAEMPDSRARKQIDRACRLSGFFYLSNHGMEEQFLQEVWSVTRWFFGLSLQRKLQVERTESNPRGFYNRELTKNIQDMKEVFDFGHKPLKHVADDHPDNVTRDGWNQWPEGDGSAHFREVLEAYYQRCSIISLKLLRVISANLESSPDALTGCFDPRHSSFLRLNYYPLPQAHSQPEPNSKAIAPMGIHHHTDAGALTVILQDEVGGLQVMINGEWESVKPVPGTLVMNIGDIVQVWSNDLYQAPLHRVTASSTSDRYSLPFFFNPEYAADYAPLPSLVSETSPARYGAINWGHFRKQRQHGDYGDYGTEIQISDFSLEQQSLRE